MEVKGTIFNNLLSLLKRTGSEWKEISECATKAKETRKCLMDLDFEYGVEYYLKTVLNYELALKYHIIKSPLKSGEADQDKKIDDQLWKWKIELDELYREIKLVYEKAKDTDKAKRGTLRLKGSRVEDGYTCIMMQIRTAYAEVLFKDGRIEEAKSLLGDSETDLEKLIQRVPDQTELYRRKWKLLWTKSCWEEDIEKKKRLQMECFQTIWALYERGRLYRDDAKEMLNFLECRGALGREYTDKVESLKRYLD